MSYIFGHFRSIYLGITFGEIKLYIVDDHHCVIQINTNMMTDAH